MKSEMRSAAQDYIAANGFGADEQTRICLFLMAIKKANVLILSKVEIQPMDWAPYSALHHQFFKEIELFSPMYRATKWTANPLVYVQMTQFNLGLWERMHINKYLFSYLSVDKRFYEYLSLSHAFMSEVRFIPLLPTDMSIEDPFLASLQAIEVESGKLIQTQIRLLDDLDVELSRPVKEQIIEEQRQLVTGLFDDFLLQFVGG